MKKLLYVVLGIIVVAVVAAVGYRGYLGIRAGDGEISREVQAERSFAGTNEDGPALGIIQYGVTSGADGESQAQFLIQEEIFGRENMVEGTTRQIDGSFLINYNEYRVQVGQFEINVRDIKTRSLDVDIESRGWTDGERDTVIRAEILESGRDEFEFATFNPTNVSGVPDTFEPGDTLELVVTGDLTLRDVTSSVDFDMQLSLDSDEKISGTAATTIRWEDFEITIPYVGGGSDVGAVSDSVELRLEFTAEEEGRVGV
ncbi:MAG: YceI family protein [Spirochaeta sp.]|jgi:polyisoprenoid-binding protein YceI|nr:YceI family protein [Spirochaeta sp.]